MNASGTVEQVNHYYPFGGLFGENLGDDKQPYKYNGKELDRMHGLDWYDYGARHYDAALCRWMCMDPLAEKYYDVSPYAYCHNNPIKFLDKDGRDPGDYFKTADDAAIDFSLLYNDNSIAKSKEYGTVIIKVEKNGKEFYTYVKPTVGYEGSVYAFGLGLSNEGDAQVVSKAHTHSSYSSNYENNEFSDSDIKNGYHYVATPNGSLLKYDANSKKTHVLSTKIPSDPNDPTRVNSIDYKQMPKNEATYNLGDFIKRNIILPILIGASSIKN